MKKTVNYTTQYDIRYNEHEEKDVAMLVALLAGYGLDFFIDENPPILANLPKKQNGPLWEISISTNVVDHYVYMHNALRSKVIVSYTCQILDDSENQ